MMLDAANSERGNGFLKLRLGRELNIALRRQVAMRDWTTAVILVSFVQFFSSLAVDTWAYAALLAAALTSFSIWCWIMPRVAEKHALKAEAALNASSLLITAFLIYSSGGADSPYVFLFALPIIHHTSFFELASGRIALVTMTCICALLPIVYDFEQATESDFISTIAVAVIVWLLTAGLVSAKRSSAMTAQMNARRLSLVDQSTGAGNRRALEQYADQLSRSGVGFSMVLVRLSGVEAISHAQGHVVGDLMLRGVVESMRASSLEVDQVGRLSDDEFAVILPLCDLGGAERWRARFRERVEILHARIDHGGRAAITAGCVQGCGGESTLSDCLAGADEAMVEITEGEAAPGLRLDPDERAAELRAKMEESRAGQKRNSITSIDAPTEALVSIPAALVLGGAIALTGGASSALFSVTILLVAYFSTFGTRAEATIATVSTLVAATAASLVNLPISSVDQIRMLTVIATVAVLAENLKQASHDLIVAERREAELSLIDSLTGLGNGSAFERALSKAIPRDSDAQSSRHNLEGLPAVIDFELADFEAVRSVFGYADSAFLLVEVAEALRDAIGAEGQAFRIGAADFAAIVQTHHPQHVDLVASRCFDQVRALETDRGYLDRGVVLNLTTGVSVWEPGMTAADLASAAIARQAPALAIGNEAAVYGRSF